MPIISKFADPHDLVPLDLVTPQVYAPALSIYFDSAGTFGSGTADDYLIAVNNTGIDITEGATTIGIPFAGSSIDMVKSKINAANLSFRANALNQVDALNTGELSIDTGDITPDRGFIIRMKRHVVKYDEETRIRLLPPFRISREMPWYARINIGQFSKDHLNSRHIFAIPEYRSQTWASQYGYPHMEVFGEEPEFLDFRQVRVARTPILWKDNNVGLRINDRSAAGMIEDVDENNGIIFLNTDIEDVNGMQVTYVYKEGSYVYKLIDLNPSVVNNPYIIGQFVLFYIIPNRSQPGNITRSRTVFHKVSPTLLGAIQSIPRQSYPITLLGALQVRQTNTIDDLSITDVRIRGGGVKESKYGEALKLNKNLHSMTDLGRADGVPYPGSSVVVFTLPNSLKATMTVDEIKQRATKHLALGVTPIVEFE